MMHLPPLTTNARLSDVILNAMLLLQLVLLCIVITYRSPRIMAARVEAAQGAKYKRSVSFANWMLRLSHLLCCTLLMVFYAFLLAFDPDASGLDTWRGVNNGAFYMACRATALVMWAICAMLVAAEMRYALHSALSLRMWWALNLVVSGATFAADILRTTDRDLHTGSHQHLVTIMQLVAFGPALFLGLAALVEPDTPSDRAYASDALLAVPSEDELEPPGRTSEATASIW